jgi:hypothetical protein
MIGPLQRTLPPCPGRRETLSCHHRAAPKARDPVIQPFAKRWIAGSRRYRAGPAMTVVGVDESVEYVLNPLTFQPPSPTNEHRNSNYSCAVLQTLY